MIFHPALVVYAAIGLVLGPLWFLHGFQAFRRKRLIENTPASRIRSMAMGLVEVNGRVAARSQTIAPFSGRACAYWQIDVSTGSPGRNGGNGSWRIVHHDQSGSPFFLTDDTGTAMVFPQGAECRVSFQVEEECSGLALPECYAEYFKEHWPAGNLHRLGSLRFRERILEDGQGVFVLGTAMPRSQAVRISDEEETLAATGTDGTGLTVQHQLLDESATATIRKGPNDPTFVISQASERELTLILGAKALGGMIGGPIASVFGLGYVLSAFHSFPFRR